MGIRIASNILREPTAKQAPPEGFALTGQAMRRGRAKYFGGAPMTLASASEEAEKVHCEEAETRAHGEDEPFFWLNHDAML